VSGPVASGLGRWFPSAFTKASAAFHGVAAVTLALDSSQFPFVVSGLVANHMILSTVGLVPRGTLLGPNITCLPAAAAARGQVALTIDDGPDAAVTPAVLEILDHYKVRATFFAIGSQILAEPDIAREIVRRGHGLENHSATHPYHFSLLGVRGMTNEVANGQKLIRQVTGFESRFFRAPAGLRNPLLQPVLSSMGLRLASWTRRGFDTVELDPTRVRRRLLDGLAAGDIILQHDGAAARTQSGQPVILEVLPSVLDAFNARGLSAVTLGEAFS